MVDPEMWQLLVARVNMWYKNECKKKTNNQPKQIFENMNFQF